jgi:Dolichyl-phosphate-mannose-protein mannosyltransferase
MTAGSFAVGALALLSMVVPVAVGARRARRRWFGGSGPSALLVEAVLFVVQIYAVAYLLGSIGWFRRWPVALGCTVIGLAVAVTAGTGRERRRETADSDDNDRLGLPSRLLAGAAAVAVFGQYVAHSLISAQRGMYDADTMWYHAPVAAHFVQDGWITRAYFFGGEHLVSYYPFNGELAAALTILPFHRDGFLPVLNLGWLALALLGGWCFGQRYHRGEVGMAAVAAALSLPIMASREAGTVDNDITGVALLLASAALLAEGKWRAPWLALSGVAAGLAFGVKLSLLPPVAALVVAVLLAAPARRRLRVMVVWGVAFAIPAAYWPIRDWVRTGNPFPWLSLHLGPLRLPALPDPGTDLHNTSVLHYLFRPGSLENVFAPGLWIAFGPAWPVILVLAALAGIATVVTGRDRLDQAVAASGLVGLALYTVIPDQVIPGLARYTFAGTSRYAVPSLAVVLVCLSGSRFLAREVLSVAVTAVLFAVVVTDQVPRVLQFYASYQWPLPASDVVLGLVISCAIAGGVMSFNWFRQDPVRLGIPAVAGVALIWPLGGAVSPQYGAATGTASTASVFSWGRHVHHSRIAVSGSWAEYPFFGADLDNRVQFVSARGPHGTFIDPSTCSTWVTALNAGHFDYLVLYPPSVFDNEKTSPAESWLKEDPAAVLLDRHPDGEVWKLLGPLDPARCRLAVSGTSR